MVDQDGEIIQENATIKGPESSYVKLISSDGFEFYIRRRFTKASKTITDMMNIPGGCDDNEPAEVNLKGIDSAALNRTCEYLMYFDRYTDAWYQIPEFPIDEKLCVELLLTANFMKC